MNMDRHISSLLYDYDCVIVPELGGFVCNYSPAKIHPVQHTFSPPSKNITFNSNLKNNDGLLANRISREEMKTFAEANFSIRDFVTLANRELGKGNKFRIEEVGTLFLDTERNIQFEPDSSINYLHDSFGLGTFRSAAIKREGVSKRLEKELKDRVIQPKKDKIPNRVRVRRLAMAAALMPFLAATVWVSINFTEIRKGNYSSLNPFADKQAPLYKPSENQIPVISEKDFAVKTEVGNTIQLPDASGRTIVVKREDDVT